MPVTLHAGEVVENVTGLPDAPPVALTANAGSVISLFASAANTIVCGARVTVRSLDPALAANPVSPSYVAAIADVYTPGSMPVMLTPVIVAIPCASVVAVPTGVLFNAKLTVRPDRPVALAVSVADRLAVAPNAALAGSTASAVGTVGAPLLKQVVTSWIVEVWVVSEVPRSALYSR